MKYSTYLLFFLIILVAHLAGIALNIPLAEYITKPMIVILIGLYFLFQTTGIDSAIKKWVLLALMFSWIGDVLLLFQQNDSLFFLLGLSAFLVAHIFYILFFHQVRVREKIKGRLWIVLIVVVYYVALIALLSSYLGEMKFPVRVYGIVISLMFMLAMHMLFIKDKAAGQRMMAGALLFILSDSALAINKFYQSFPFAGILIMLTYALAQFFIVEGSTRYIASTYKE